MSSIRIALLPGLLALLGAGIAAQVPKDAPPWWGTADEDTVSLYWDFNNSVTPLAPTAQVLPSWYSPLPTAGNNWGFTNSGGITWIASLNGQSGVMGFTGAGSETISVKVDNEYRSDWIKIFFAQFDEYAAGGSKVVSELRKDLLDYKRAILEEKSEPLPNGWVRTTIGLYLIPQPYDEDLDFTLAEVALGSVAIDNLYVNSKCVKPPPDEKGKAYGEIDGNYDLNLSAATGNQNVTAVAATESGGVAPALTFWVASRNTANSDQVVRLDATGVQLGTAIPLPAPTAVNGGAADLAVARVLVPGPTPVLRTFVYGIMDRRASGATIDLVGIDADLVNPVVVPALQVSFNAPNLIDPGALALAYSPHGNLGSGSFWIADQSGNVVEVARTTGAVLRTLNAANDNIPPGIRGAGYDPLTAHLYWFSDAPTPTLTGPTRIMVHEHDGYTLQPTGVRCLADRSLPNPPAGPPGGLARGLEVLRRSNGEFKLLCVQQAGGQSFLRAINGPFRFGWSVLGRIGMRGMLERGGPFQITLRGVPRATTALCYVGFSNQTYLGQQLPLDLGTVGMDESRLSISPDMFFFGVQQPDSTFLFAGTVPAVPAFPPGMPVYFQWAVADARFPLGFAASQAGEAILY